MLAVADPAIIDDAPVLPLAVDCGGGAAWGATVVDFRAPFFATLEGSEQSSPHDFAPWRIALGVDVARFRASRARALRRLISDARSAAAHGSRPTMRRYATGSVAPSVHSTSTRRPGEVGRAGRHRRPEPGERGGAGLARDDADRREIAHRLFGGGVVDRDEHVGAGEHGRPRDDRNRAAVQAGHDRVVRPGHHHGMPGLRGMEPARGRERLDHDDGRPRRVVRHDRGRERADTHGHDDDLGRRVGELLVDLGEDRRVPLDDRARDLGVPVPRRVGHDEHVVGRERGRGAHRVVVGAVDDGDRRAFALDRVDARRGRARGDEDARCVAEEARHVRDRAAVVPVGRGDEGQRSERRERAAQLVEIAPLGLVAEPAHEQPVDGPRRAEDLERGQSEPARLVLDRHLRQAELRRDAGRVDHRGRRVPGEAAVEPSGRDVGRRCAPLSCRRPGLTRSLGAAGRIEVEPGADFTRMQRISR